MNSYREEPAPAGQAGVVACLWRNEMSAVREQRVLPDGCMDLIWMDGAVHVAGPDTRAFLATVRPRQVVTSLRFRPGAAPGVRGVPAVATAARALAEVDHGHPGGQVLPAEVLRERVAVVPQMPRRFADVGAALQAVG